jgi:LacI family transcriptional regulator
MRDHDLQRESETLAVFADTFAGGAGVEPMRELLARGSSFTAVFAANDLLALDAIDVLGAAGHDCPRDVSVVGFNDMPFADRFNPPLTTVRFSHYEMGRRAAELLLGQIGSDSSQPTTVVLSTELVERASTSRLASDGQAARRATASRSNDSSGRTGNDGISATAG